MSDQLPTVYVGPTSTKLGLTRFNQYTQLSEQVQDAMENHPSLRLLLVPLDQFHGMRQDVFNNQHSTVNHAIIQLTTDKVL
jgi:hypothetical protein